MMAPSRLSWTDARLKAIELIEEAVRAESNAEAFEWVQAELEELLKRDLVQVAIAVTVAHRFVTPPPVRAEAAKRLRGMWWKSTVES